MRLPPRARAVNDDGTMTPEFWRSLESLFRAMEAAPLGHMAMLANATATTGTGSAVKASGTTTGEMLEKFEHSANRLAYTGTQATTVHVSVIASMTSTAFNVLGLFIAKNGAVVANSAGYRTADAAGKAECTVQTVVDLVAGDYIEAWVKNTTAANDITVTYLSVVAR